MKSNWPDLRNRLILALLVWVACHYAYVLPVAAMGMWRQRLLPGMNWWSMSGHLLVIGIAWAITGSVKALKCSTAVVLVAGVVINQATGGWPEVGMRYFAENLTATVLQYFASPLLVYVLLHNGDALGPVLLRNWRR